MSVKAAFTSAIRNSDRFQIAEFTTLPFIVLIVCPPTARRDNAIGRLLANDPPTLTQAWLTTFDETTADPLGPIWIRPRDYRDVIHGTAFDFQDQSDKRPYRRQPERGAIIEGSFEKHPLFGD